MPTFVELQRQRPNLPTSQDLQVYGEEVIADSRAGLTPSQLVDRKLESRTASELPQPRFPGIRPRAK